MAVFLVLLATLIVAVSGRPEATDEQELLSTITKSTHCRTTFQVIYPAEEGELPYPLCSSRCPGGEEMWIDGVIFKRLIELEEYGLMVQMTYINGSLHDCKMVPHETGEEATAEKETQKRCTDSCYPIDQVSQDETLVLSQTERIPSSSSLIPIHKRLEGFSRVGDSYYMVSPDVMTRHAAVPYCERLGAALASIDSIQERKLLEGILATGVWTASNVIMTGGNLANEGSASTTYSNALCEHPQEDDLNNYTCPYGYWKYKSSCYTSSADKLTYSDGEKFCSGIGAYPVFINSKEEQAFMREKVSWHFLGYTDIDVEGKFNSKRFGLAIYTRWAPKEPNDAFGNEDCVTIDSGNDYLWNDVPCHFTARMMCEKSAEIAD